MARWKEGEEEEEAEERECRQDKDTEDKSGLVIVKMLTRTLGYTLKHTHTPTSVHILREL